MASSSQSAAPVFPLKERLRIGASLLAPFALLWIASRSRWIPLPPNLCLIAMPCAVALGMLFPNLFAGWHRFFSGVQKWLGHRILAVLLGAVFLVAIVPMSLWLRVRGRSFLEYSAGDSFWQAPPQPGPLKNQF